MAYGFLERGGDTELEVLRLYCKLVQLKWINLGISLLPKGLNI